MQQARLRRRPPWIEVDLSQVFHGFGPQALETLRQLVSKSLIADQKGCESSFAYERVVQRQNDEIIIDDMKWMTDLTGISDARHTFQVSLIFLNKADEP